jgi:hypothetical protein
MGIGRKQEGEGAGSQGRANPTKLIKLRAGRRTRFINHHIEEAGTRLDCLNYGGRREDAWRRGRGPVPSPSVRPCLARRGNGIRVVGSMLDVIFGRRLRFHTLVARNRSDSSAASPEER